MTTYNDDMKVWHEGYEAGRNAHAADEWALHIDRMRAINRLRSLSAPFDLWGVCRCFIDNNTIPPLQLRDELVRLLGGDNELGRVEPHEMTVEELSQRLEYEVARLEGLIEGKADKNGVICIPQATTVTPGHIHVIDPNDTLLGHRTDPNVVRTTTTFGGGDAI